jgi:hypothetical protein
VANFNPTPEQQQALQKVMRYLLRLMSEKAHCQVLVTLRDGNIQLLNEQRARLLKDLP